MAGRIKAAPSALTLEERRHEKLQLVRTIGARMKAARELCNMSQLEAARLLGYANSSKLAKIEAASDTNNVPLVVIIAAAKLYDVSTDYLFGMTEDWEPAGDPLARDATAIHRWMLSRRVEESAKELALLNNLGKRLTAVEKALIELNNAVVGGVEAFLTFWSMNADTFDDLPAGAKLLRSYEQAESALNQVKPLLNRFRADFKVWNFNLDE